MKPFDLTAAKAGKPVVTLYGKDARIICFDAVGEYPIIGLIKNDDGFEYPVSYSESSINLFFCMKSQKKVGWINIYKSSIISNHYRTGNRIFCTEEKAIREKSEIWVSTIKIEWEE